jgi:hypothetical protein
MRKQNKFTTGVLCGALVAFTGSFIPQAAHATGSTSTTCSAATGGVTVENGSELNITVVEGDTIQINNGAGNTVNLYGPGHVGLLKVSTNSSGSYVVPPMGDGTYLIGRVHYMSTTTVTCIPSGGLTSTADVQNAFTSAQVITQLSGLYSDVTQNISGALNGGVGPQITQNTFFFQSRGLVDKTSKGAAPEWSVWGSGDYAAIDGQTFNGKQANLIVGADRTINSDTVIGGLLSYGTADFDTNVGGTIGALDSDGITVGLYAGKKLTNGLTFDGLLTYTTLDYDVADGTTTGQFGANRVGISFGMYNQIALKSVVIEPRIRVTYGDEDQDAYVDSTTAAIAARNITSGRASVGSKVYFNTKTDGLTPWVSLNGEYDFTDTGTLATSAPNFDETFSLRAGMGVNYITDMGDFRAELDIGGIGTNVFDETRAKIFYRLSF